MPEPYNDAKDAVRRQYGAVGDAYVKSTGHATGPDLARMVEIAAPTGAERLLDIATGGGHVVRVFAPLVASAVASDLTPEILAHATSAFREWGIENATAAIADAEALPFADASFEIVTCRIAPHHFPDPEAFVAEVARVLVSGGRFLLVDSTVEEGEAGEMFNRFEQLRDPSHVRSLTVAEWTGLLDGAGFTIDVVESFTKQHDFVDWTARSRTSEADKAGLEQMIREAPAAFHATFDPDTGDVLGFTDTKTLFAARR